MAPEKLSFATGTLRNVDSLEYKMTDAYGKVVQSATTKQPHRSLYIPGAKQFSSVEAMSPNPPEFSAKDQDGNPLPDGTYQVSVNAKTTGPSPTEQKLVYEVAVDTAAPAVWQARVGGETPTISALVNDKHRMAGYTVHDPATDQVLFRKVVDDEGEVDSVSYHNYKLSIPVSEIATSWKALGNTSELPKPADPEPQPGEPDYTPKPSEGTMPQKVAEIEAQGTGTVFYGDWDGDGTDELAEHNGKWVTYQPTIGAIERYPMIIEGLTETSKVKVKYAPPGQPDKIVIVP